MAEEIIEEEKKLVTLEEFEALKATNERIIAEHRADKNKFKDRLSTYEIKDREALEKANDFKSLHEQAVTKIGNLEKDLTETKYNSFEKNLTLEVGKLCKDAYSPAQVMRSLSVSSENTDLETGTLTDLSVQIDELRKNEPNLFVVNQTNQTTSVPRYMKSEPGNEKTIGEMTTSEVENQLRNRAASRK